MKENCSHHPTRDAHFICHHCDLGFCSECITSRPKAFPLKHEMLHLCPKCNREADWVGVENIIDPFWKRFHVFFIYPFRLHPLIFIVVLSIVDAYFSAPTLFSRLMQVVLWALLLKYAFSCLQATIEGDLIPPKISTKTISSHLESVFKQFGIYVFIALGTLAIMSLLGLVPGLIFMVVTILSLPAMIMILVVTDRFFHAVNPVVFVGLIFRIGWGYLLMFLFLLLLLVAPYLCHQQLSGMFEPGMAGFVAGMAESYYTIISYHLMGYVILQYHDRVGFQVDFENFRGYEPQAEKTIEDPDKDILSRVSVLIQEKKPDEAVSVIREYTANSGFTGLALSERYYNLLKMLRRSEELMEHSKVHLDLLANENQKTKACAIYAASMAKDPGFTPSALCLFKLAGWLNETGKAKAAVATFNKLIKAYPDDHLVPKAYFRSAQIFNDRLMQPEKAKRILSGLVKKYPNHDILPQVRNYLASMGI